MTSYGLDCVGKVVEESLKNWGVNFVEYKEGFGNQLVILTGRTTEITRRYSCSYIYVLGAVRGQNRGHVYDSVIALFFPIEHRRTLDCFDVSCKKLVRAKDFSVALDGSDKGETLLRKLLMELLQIEQADLSLKGTDYGADSLTGVALVERLSQKLGIELPVSLADMTTPLNDILVYIRLNCGDKLEGLDVDDSSDQRGNRTDDSSVTAKDKASMDWHGAPALKAKKSVHPRILTKDMPEITYRNVSSQKTGKMVEVIVRQCDPKPTDTLLFLLPFNTTAAFVLGFMIHLPKNVRLVTFHYPGGGESEYSERIKNFDDVAELAIEILDILEIKEPVGVSGASYGGFAAQVIES